MLKGPEEDSMVARFDGLLELHFFLRLLLIVHEIYAKWTYAEYPGWSCYQDSHIYHFLSKHVVHYILEFNSVVS